MTNVGQPFDSGVRVGGLTGIWLEARLKRAWDKGRYQQRFYDLLSLF